MSQDAVVTGDTVTEFDNPSIKRWWGRHSLIMASTVPLHPSQSPAPSHSSNSPLLPSPSILATGSVHSRAPALQHHSPVKAKDLSSSSEPPWAGPTAASVIEWTAVGAQWDLSLDVSTQS
ncbi:hypothetical protein INR49_012502, partial [Caranx melampygus]